MNVSVSPHREEGDGDCDAIYSNTLSQLEVIIWDLKREMLRGISKIIDEDYDRLCEKYCPASRPIQSCTTMIVPVIQPIQETLEGSVYVQPMSVCTSVSTSAVVSASATSSGTGNLRKLRQKSEDGEITRRRARARLDRKWIPDLHCHCRRVNGFCYETVTKIEDMKRMCTRHYNHYMDYKRGNNEKNQWFGFVEDKPDITNTNPKIFRKWRDGKLLQGDTYDYEGQEIYVRLKHHTLYVALYTTPSESQAQTQNMPIAGYYSIYTNEFVTLPVHLWDVKVETKAQRDPSVISKEIEGYPVYSLE